MTTATKNNLSLRGTKQSQAKQSQGGGSKEQPALPYQAYAIVVDRDAPATWQLPHHTSQVNRAVQGKIGYEHTVDWQTMTLAVLSLSRQGVEGQRVQAEPSDIIAAARHLATHYHKAGKPLPDALAVLV